LTTADSGARAAIGRRGVDALERFVSTHWLKRRVVLEQRAVADRSSSRVLPIDLAVEIYSGRTSERSLDKGLLDVLARTVGTDVLGWRLAHPDITLVLGVDSRSQAVMGFRWILHPTAGTVWHDNIPIEPGDAYGFNEFTYPTFRRRGVYGKLISDGNRYVFEELGLPRIAIVVEASNRASLGANLRAGYAVVGTNYLFKIWKRNVYSVFRDAATGKTRTYFVYRNERAGRL